MTCWCGGADGQHRFGWDSDETKIAPPPPEDYCELTETHPIPGRTLVMHPVPPEDWNLQEISVNTYDKLNALGAAMREYDKELEMNGQETKDGGKKFDENKPRWELIPYDAIKGVAEVLTDGARKYSARNWELGIAYGRVFGALQRHLTAWWQGENNDPESGRSHLDHAMCELMFLSAYEKRGMITFDDRPGSLLQSAKKDVGMAMTHEEARMKPVVTINNIRPIKG